MLSAARGETLWRLGRLHMPRQVALFEAYAPLLGTVRAEEGLRDLYDHLEAADFSRELVAAYKGLRVTAMDGAGWSDCGTPERLAAVLGETSASRTVCFAERPVSAEAVA